MKQSESRKQAKAKSKSRAKTKAKPKQTSALALCQPEEAGRAREPHIHIYGHGAVCDTDKLGHATPRGRSPLEIVVNAPGGVVPLWQKDMMLRWRFQERSMSIFADPDAAKTEITALMGEALLAWGDSAPVRFTQADDAVDFEIVVRRSDDCDINGCVLASAFFPDAGRHELVLYPRMFSQIREEMVDTMIHEIGHIFGLRHFFALISETAWPAEIFGTHRRFSIMNYGSDSVLTDEDKDDLKNLYQSAWSGALTHINGTPIQFVRPFSATGGGPFKISA